MKERNQSDSEREAQELMESWWEEESTMRDR
jgi:hypothetical protein